MGTLAILGAGNVGQAIAGHMTLTGHDVRVYSRWESDFADIRANDGITLTGEVEGHAQPAMLTTQIADAVTGADIVLIAAPAFAHSFLSAQLADLLEPEQLVLFQPAMLGSALELTRMFTLAERPACLVAETATSLYTCRLRGPATVYVGAIKHSIAFASIPSAQGQEAADRLEPFFGTPYAVEPDTLGVGLANCNPIYHLPPAILNFKTVEDAAGLPLHSLVTPRIAEVIDQLDKERLTLAEALGVQTPSFWEFLESAYGVDEGSFVERIHAGYGRQAFPEPDSLQHRYFTEDIPYGLLTWDSLADEVGIDLPLTRALLRLSEVLCGQDWESGRTTGKLGLSGLDASQIKHAFEFGASESMRTH